MLILTLSSITSFGFQKVHCNESQGNPGAGVRFELLITPTPRKQGTYDVMHKVRYWPGGQTIENRGLLTLTKQNPKLDFVFEGDAEGPLAGKIGLVLSLNPGEKPPVRVRFETPVTLRKDRWKIKNCKVDDVALTDAIAPEIFEPMHFPKSDIKFLECKNARATVRLECADVCKQQSDIKLTIDGGVAQGKITHGAGGVSLGIRNITPAVVHYLDVSPVKQVRASGTADVLEMSSDPGLPSFVYESECRH